MLNGSLVSRFEEMVSRHPDRIAIRAADATFTYRELADRSHRIASGILAGRGSSPEPIGILLPQSAALCVAIMGVLKAGKFYVPMDPSHPAARNAQVQADGGCELHYLSGSPLDFHQPGQTEEVAELLRVVLERTG